jgi:hypothetical protein
MQSYRKTLILIERLFFVGVMFGIGFGFSFLVLVMGSGIVDWINALTSKEVDFIGSVGGAVTTILAALVGVLAAFSQIRKQFEHKVIHTAWENFQQHLFNFSSALIDYSSVIQWLNYFVTSQNNPLVNAGNITKHRTDKWDEINNQHNKVITAYFNLLSSFESYEIIFMSLRKMKSEFNEVTSHVLLNKHKDLIDDIFPEFIGQPQTKTIDQQVQLINHFWRETTVISAYLDDFRTELQNETLGVILDKHIPGRRPKVKCKILTKDGLILFKPNKWFKTIRRLKHELTSRLRVV